MRRGRPRIIDQDQVDRDVLKFINPVRTTDMKLGYPTGKVWSYINHFYHRNYSRATIHRSLMRLWKKGLIMRLDKYHRYYWKGRHLRYAFEYEVGRHKDQRKIKVFPKTKGEYDVEYKLRVKEFERLGLDVHSPLDTLNDGLPLVSKDIIRYEPNQILISSKQGRIRIMIKKPRKSEKET